MKTRLQRFPATLPKRLLFLLLFLLVGTSHECGCDDIGLLNLRNVDTTCLGVALIKNSDQRASFVSAGDRVTFFVQKGLVSVQTCFTSILNCEGCSSLEDFEQMGEPNTACPCLVASNPERDVSELRVGDGYFAALCKTSSLTVDPEANTVFYCDESQTPPVVVVEGDFGQGPL